MANGPHRLGQSVHGEKQSGNLVQSPMQLSAQGWRSLFIACLLAPQSKISHSHGHRKQNGT